MKNMKLIEGPWNVIILEIVLKPQQKILPIVKYKSIYLEKIVSSLCQIVILIYILKLKKSQ